MTFFGNFIFASFYEWYHESETGGWINHLIKIGVCPLVGLLYKFRGYKVTFVLLMVVNIAIAIVHQGYVHKTGCKRC